jgi:biopolymer transport protein ExbB
MRSEFSFARAIAPVLATALLLAANTALAQQQIVQGVQVNPSAGPLQPSASQPVPPQPAATTPESLPNAPEAAAQPPAAQSAPPAAPLGTAAAEQITAAGGGASRPAGNAIAPAKQHQYRSLVIKLGAVAAAGIAVGTVYALSHGTPSVPPHSASAK